MRLVHPAATALLTILLHAELAAAQPSAAPATPSVPGAPRATTPAPEEPAPPAATPVAEPAPPAAATTEPKEPVALAPASASRKTSAEPMPTERPPPGPQRFEAEPVRDVSILAVSVGFASMLELVSSTGEVRPQQISPSFNTNQLLSIDRGVLTATPDASAAVLSNIGLYAAAAFAVIDPIATGFREQSVQSAIVDSMIYGQSIALTWGVTNLVKIGVRRPRPLAYIDAEKHKDDPTYVRADLDSSLSFFSGHVSTCAAITATSSYLAFARSPRSIRPWVTLAVGSAVTTFVGYERVNAQKHFPTDVISAAMAGAGIGILVPLLHRAETQKQRPLWVGFAPAIEQDGGAVTLSGLF